MFFFFGPDQMNQTNRTTSVNAPLIIFTQLWLQGQIMD